MELPSEDEEAKLTDESDEESGKQEDFPAIAEKPANKGRDRPSQGEYKLSI